MHSVLRQVSAYEPGILPCGQPVLRFTPGHYLAPPRYLFFTFLFNSADVFIHLVFNEHALGTVPPGTDGVVVDGR